MQKEKDVPPEDRQDRAGRIVANAGDTLANAVRRHLGDAIIDGVYPPGSRLEETVLSRQLGVSRTPVREALQQLAAAGVVAIRPNAGAVVVAITGDRLPVLLEAVVELESLCAQLAASRLLLAERLGLRAAIEACETAVAARDMAAFIAANRRFHEILVKGAHNADIEAAVSQIRIKVAPFRKAQFRQAERMDALHPLQRQVAAMIERQDGAGAGMAMRRCLEDEMSAILGMFNA